MSQVYRYHSKTLAAALLREHPADSDEPLDEAFLLSVGFRWDVDKALELDGLQGWIVGDGDPEWQWMGCIVRSPANRGQLRSPAASLGIELREGK